MEGQIKIYTLTDPRDNMVFYVGASASNETCLLSRHSGTRNKGRRLELRYKWKRPILHIIETTDSPKTAAALEEFWINQFRCWGFPLENSIRYIAYSGSKKCEILKTA